MTMILTRFLRRAGTLAGACVAIFGLAVSPMQAQNYDFQRYLGSNEYLDVATKVRSVKFNGAGSIFNDGYITIGHFTYNQYRNTVLTRTNQDGSTAWFYAYPGRINGVDCPNWGNSVIQTNDNYFVGVGGALVDGREHALFFRVDATGLNFSAFKFFTTEKAEFWDVVESNGEFIAVGWEEGDDGNRDIFVARIAYDGTLLQRMMIDGPQITPRYMEEGRSIVKTPNGYAITGFRRRDNIGALEELAVVEIDSNLSVVNSYVVFTYPGHIRGHNIVRAFDGDYVIAGGVDLPAGSGNAARKHGFVYKITPIGIPDWLTFIDDNSEAFQVEEKYRYISGWGGYSKVTDGFVTCGYSNGVLSTDNWREFESSRAFLAHLNSTDGTLIRSRSYEPTGRTTTLDGFRSLALVQTHINVFGDVGVAAVGEAERIDAEPTAFHDQYFVKTNGFTLETACYTQHGPSIEQPAFVGYSVFPTKTAPTVLVKGGHLIGGYWPYKTICSTYHEIGKQSRFIPGEEEAQVAVYPHPARAGETVHVRLGAVIPSDNGIRVEVQDMMGRTIYSGMAVVGVEGELQMVLPSVATGMYTVRIMGDDRVIRTSIMIAE